MCSCPVCWNSVRGLLQSGHNENFNTEFENILKVVLPYIVLVDINLRYFVENTEKPDFKRV